MCCWRRPSLASRFVAVLVAAAVVVVAAALTACVSLQSDAGGTTVTSQSSTTLVAATTTTEPYHSAVHIGAGSSGGASGAPVIKRQGGTTLFTCALGSKPGQFGLNEDWGSDLVPAVSPDGKIIAILDPENSRVQSFSRSGQLQKVIPIEGWGAQAIALGPGGLLYVLGDLSDAVVTLIKPDGTQTTAHCAGATEWGPSDLFVIGSEVWVGEGGITFYKVFEGVTPLDESRQRDTVQQGVPVGDKTYSIRWGDRLILITDSRAGDTATVQIADGIIPSDLPLDEIHNLGSDARGNFYFMVRIWGEGWGGQESWDFFGLTPDGKSLGTRMSPLDFYAGGGWTVTPAGKIIEVCSTKDGVGVVEYSLK
jgi:hypothetical protein